MTNVLALPCDYLRRARLSVSGVEALIAVGDFPDAVRPRQGSIEPAVKAVLKLKGLTYPRGRAFERNGTSLS